MSTAANDPDLAWMHAALALAERAQRDGEVPVAAIVVRDGALIGQGWNRNRGTHDPSAHAEIEALREAGRKLQNHRLLGCTLYCTLEPCVMCVGALVHARVARLVYAAAEPKTGACESAFELLPHPGHNHYVEVRAGIMRNQSQALLRDFFQQKRCA